MSKRFLASTWWCPRSAKAVELPLDDIAARYRERKARGRDKSFHRAIDRSFGYFRKVAGNRKVEASEREDALKLRYHLNTKGLAPQSIRRTVPTFRSAFNLAINEHGLTLKNIVASLDVGKAAVIRKRNPLDGRFTSELGVPQRGGDGRAGELGSKYCSCGPKIRLDCAG